ncbi:unnamed protein product [Brachionus calyciflorus]|uniref:G-protein coupled receptors family 1 profile domain-containing protein n=1 Tax=Brachionus calyciflorus TaxID=104777 RepID=A0A814AEP3_9BILA|nr:unnamed protein product [Brachionus calyciflorus]
MHFFEDTLRTYIDVYLNDQTNSIGQVCLNFKPISLNNKTESNSLLRIINITDRFNLSCRFESNKNALDIVTLIFIIGLFINIWVPFLFNTITDSNTTYCDINKEFSKAYFYLTIFYIALTMFVPILVIFICNALIIKFVLKAIKNRKNMTNNIELTKSSCCNERKTLISRIETSTYQNKSLISLNSIASKSVNKIKKKSSSKKESNKITIMLLLMSFSYASLNLPYFISWCYIHKL